MNTKQLTINRISAEAMSKQAILKHDSNDLSFKVRQSANKPVVINTVNNTQKLLENTLTIDTFFYQEAKCLPFHSQSSVYFEGDAASCVYFIDSGMVKLINHMPNGRARIVRILGAGTIFGLEGILQEEYYKHTAVALGDARIYRIAVPRLRMLMQHNSELTTKIIEHWHNHLYYADTWITQFSAGAIKSRVARLVNFLGIIEYGQDSLCVRLLTCEEMAEVLGVTPESVSRVLAQFKRDHILLPIQERPFEVYKRDKNRLLAVANL
jgi:CRP/FNR family transcriptional regulator